MQQSHPQVILNGTLMSSNQALIPATSEGCLFGCGLFETLRVHARQVAFAKAHWERFTRSAGTLGYHLPQGFDATLEQSRQLIEANDFSEGAIRWTLLKDGSAGHLLLTTRPLSDGSDGPLTLTISSTSVPRRSPTSGHKTTDYLPWLAARKEAVSRGFDDGLMLTEGGVVSECGVSNIFIKTPRGRWLTPSLGTGALNGITRAWALEQLKHHPDRPEVEAIEFPLSKLQEAEAVFVTNSLRGVVAISRMDTVAYRSESDPHILYLQKAFAAELAQLASSAA